LSQRWRTPIAIRQEPEDIINEYGAVGDRIDTLAIESGCVIRSSSRATSRPRISSPYRELAKQTDRRCIWLPKPAWG
jgi:hypothetical protein